MTIKKILLVLVILFTPTVSYAVDSYFSILYGESNGIGMEMGVAQPRSFGAFLGFAINIHSGKEGEKADWPNLFPNDYRSSGSDTSSNWWGGINYTLSTGPVSHTLGIGADLAYIVSYKNYQDNLNMIGDSSGKYWFQTDSEFQFGGVASYALIFKNVLVSVHYFTNSENFMFGLGYRF